MTLPASGQIQFSQVNTELGRSSTTNGSLGESAVRTLAGVPSGQIAFSNLHGKSNFSLLSTTPGGQYIREWEVPSGTAHSYISADADGWIEWRGANDTAYGTATGTGIATGKYWRWVSGSPNYTTMTQNAWYAVGGGHYVGVLRSTNGTTSTTVGIQFANDSGGSGQTGTGSWTLTAIRSIL